jgi:hypothetical protein
MSIREWRFEISRNYQDGTTASGAVGPMDVGGAFLAVVYSWGLDCLHQ